MIRGTGVHLQWGVKIPMRDGTLLAGTLYLPEDQREPAPAVFILTPYVAQSFHERGTYFAARGYPFMAVDVRGRGNSDGEFECFGNVSEDGYDIVEWLARQAYCNGKVAMWGGSYQGYAQWATAAMRPPHLATIVPVASPSPGFDAPMRNNIGVPYTVQWLNTMAGLTFQDRIFFDQSFWSRQFKRWFVSGTPFSQVDDFLGHPTPIFRKFVSHPHLGDFWDRLNLTAEQYSNIAIPVLTITGICDADQPGALLHYREHLRNNPRARHYLVIGPWDHQGTRTPQIEFGGLKVGPASLVDLPRLHAEWYMWTMCEGSKPDFLERNVAYYVMGAERWRYADTLDGITASQQPLFLQSRGNPLDVFKSGSLVPQPPATSEPDHYVYDPRDISLAELECDVGPWTWTDQRMTHASIGKQLVYHGAPLEADTEISGFFKLTVWMSIDQPDTDFSVSVYEVALDGSVIRLADDSLRARYRESLREPKLIRTTEPLRYDFERFMFVSRQLKAGSRLRLIIGPVNSIFSEKNYNSGGTVAEESLRDARPVLVKLFHDRQYPSVLQVPLAHPE